MEALNNFVIDFLEYPDTFIKINQKSNTNGFALRNEKLDLQLNIFSDKNNSIYFEFYYDEPFEHKPNQAYPTYKVNNLDEYKPLLNKLLESLDSQNISNYTSEYNKLRSELFSLHRKVLKDENLPDGYSLPEGYKHSELNSHLVIKKNNILFSCLSRDKILQSLSILNRNNEPLSFLRVDFSLYNDYRMDESFIYVPNYDLHSYPFLDMLNKMVSKIPQSSEVNTKHYNKVTTSLNDWFEKILEKPEIQQSPIKNIILKNYLLINLNNENKDNKKRIKL